MALLVVVWLIVCHCTFWAAGDHGLVVSDEEMQAYLRAHGMHTTPTTTPPVLLYTMEPKMFMENKQQVHYCEYKGVRFGPGTDFMDMEECVWVRCSEYEFRMQKQPKLKYTPEHDDHKKCTWIVAGCKRIWVLAKKPRRKCPSSHH